MLLKKNLIRLFFPLFAVFFTTCITPFTPEGIDSLGGTLVVEGDIVLNGYTKIYLSVSKALDSSAPDRYLTEARVFVLSDRDEEYEGALVVPTDEPPYFLIDTKGLPLDRRYSLSVFLANGTLQFVSDPMAPLVTPEVGSVDYEVNETATDVEVTVTTYGSQHDSFYYKWNYTEDWEIESPFLTSVYWDPAARQIRRYPSGTYPLRYCWRRSQSTAILVAKTDHLTNNTVSEMPLHSIDCTNDRISYLYSMEVSQMSISQRAYIYWRNLQKNTDEIGGIFAPQPSEMSGNIRFVPAGDPELDIKDVKVLGYISVGTVATKRIFVDAQELGIYRRSFSCPAFNPDIYDNPVLVPHPFDAGFLPVQDLEGEELLWITGSCVDCSRRGSKNKPSFWPNDHL